MVPPKVLLAGATGLVGALCLDQLLAAGATVVTVGRRATGRTDGEILTDFATVPELPVADVAICALGTTIAAAGGQAAFRAIDHDAVLAFAAAARAAGVDRFVVVTAIGANARSGVFYSRVKGEVEAALSQQGFSRLDILQPGLLLGPRTERRPGEALMQRLAPVLNPLLIGGLDRYGAIDAAAVAAASVTLIDTHEPGVHRHENRALAALSKRR